MHRDVKPSNILIVKPARNKEGGKARKEDQARVVLSDFGLCKKVTGNTSFTCTGGPSGTDGWIAPEMINAEDKKMVCNKNDFA